MPAYVIFNVEIDDLPQYQEFMQPRSFIRNRTPQNPPHKCL